MKAICSYATNTFTTGACKNREGFWSWLRYKSFDDTESRSH